MEVLYTERGEIKAVVFDATVRELHQHSATATNHPVESGAPVTDHVKPEPDQLSVDVHVTNTPIISPNVDGANGEVRSMNVQTEARSQSKGAKVSREGNVTAAEYENNRLQGSAMVLQFGGGFDRVGSVYEVLARLCKEGVDVTVVTSLRQWDSMLISRVSTPREAASRHAVTFQVDFQEVRFAETETVGTPEPLETRAERARRRGAQGTEDAESEEDVSLAAQLLEGTTGIGLIHEPRRSGQGIFTR